MVPDLRRLAVERVAREIPEDGAADELVEVLGVDGFDAAGLEAVLDGLLADVVADQPFLFGVASCYAAFGQRAVRAGRADGLAAGGPQLADQQVRMGPAVERFPILGLDERVGPVRLSPSLNQLEGSGSDHMRLAVL